jgi:hypothetical protein
MVLPSYIQNDFNVSANPTTNPMYEFYQLAKNEALVIVMALPPQGAYYSYQGYMFERQNITLYGTPYPTGTSCTPNGDWTTSITAGGTTYSFPHKLSMDCKYQEFGFYGNAINDADVLYASGLHFNDPSNPTGAIAIIATSNTQVYADLVASLPSGISSTLLFLDPMPGGTSSSLPPALKMGVDSSSDVDAAIIRYARPLNGNDGQSWISSSASNVLVYRVLDSTAPVTNAYLYNSTATLSQSYNTNEVAGLGTTPPTCPVMATSHYYCDIQELSNLIWQYLGSPTNYSLGATAGGFPGTQGVNGLNCILYGLACAGGTQDNTGYDSYNIGPLVYGYPAFVIGVDHATSAINNANYIGVSAASVLYNAGVTDILDTNPTSTFAITSATGLGGTNPPLTNYLYGSASSVLTILEAHGYTPSSQLAADAPNLYVAAFARLNMSGACNSSTAFYCNVSNPFVTLLSPSSSGPNYLPASASVLTTERKYEFPGTSSTPAQETGANPAYIQPPYVLYYNPSCSSTSTPPCL